MSYIIIAALALLSCGGEAISDLLGVLLVCGFVAAIAPGAAKWLCK